MTELGPWDSRMFPISRPELPLDDDDRCDVISIEMGSPSRVLLVLACAAAELKRCGWPWEGPVLAGVDVAATYDAAVLARAGPAVRGVAEGAELRLRRGGRRLGAGEALIPGTYGGLLCGGHRWSACRARVCRWRQAGRGRPPRRP